MAKKMSPLDIMNVMGGAADQKAKMPMPAPQDEQNPPLKKAGPKKPMQGNQIAAMKAKGK